MRKQPCPPCKHGPPRRRKRSAWLASATQFKPHVVIIKLGTNDTKPGNWKHKAEFADDLRAMIDHFTALPSRPKIYLSTAAPVGPPELFPDGVHPNAQGAALMAAAAKKGISAK